MALTTRQQQSEFAHALGLLIIYAYRLGFEITLGDTTARDGHREGSFHYVRLAIDLNLFREGTYLRETEDYTPLGEFWEYLGGTWGGRWDDGNHFSWGE
jgi:hypothetical protein